MGVTPARVSQLLAGDGNVRIATLARLAEAVGSDITLTATDRATRAQLVAPRPRVRGVRERHGASAPEATTAQVRDRMKALAPVVELRRRGVLPAGTLDEEKAALCDLLEITDVWAEPAFLAVARRHNMDEPVSPRQKIWLACARKAAREREAASFDREAAAALAASLTRSLRDPAGIADLPRRLAEVGIRLVFVAPFPGNKISGVSFLLDGDAHQPVIALSGRGKRFDKVIFTLLHELAHVIPGHPRRAAFVIDGGEDGEGDIEAAANDLARRWALPLPMAVPDDIDDAWVTAEAERQGVHRMIVVGRLQLSRALGWGSALGRNAPDAYGWLERW